MLPFVEKEGESDAIGDGIEEAVPPPPKAKPRKRVMTQQHRQFYAKNNSIVGSILYSEVNANPGYRLHTNRPPLAR